MHLGQPNITESNVILTQTEENFISLPDAGESGHSVWELPFTAKPLSNCSVVLL